MKFSIDIQKKEITLEEETSLRELFDFLKKIDEDFDKGWKIVPAIKHCDTIREYRQVLPYILPINPDPFPWNPNDPLRPRFPVYCGTADVPLSLPPTTSTIPIVQASC